MDEKMLISQIRSGCAKSFRSLYELYVNDLYRFIYQYVKSEDITDEIIQDTFIRLWMHRERLDESKSVKSYLFTISYRQVLKELRRQVRNPLMRDYVEFVDFLAVESRQAYDYDLFLRTLKLAKEDLPPRQREIWQLSREDGLSSAEIAQMLSISDQVVRNQLSAAMRKIRERLLKLL